MTVTRFAPSPTGLLHPGHALAAFIAWQSGDRCLLRIEDIDQARARAEFVTAIFTDLQWLGLTWPEPVLYQSRRMNIYRAALARLEEMGVTYPCFCTRAAIARQIAAAGLAPSGPAPVYPGTCRALSRAERNACMRAGHGYAIRLDMAQAVALAGPLTFREHAETLPADPMSHGDVVIARKDMPTSYHLSVVLDDAEQGVTLVTRGADLLAATHVQRLLQALLHLPAPAYAHHRLIVDEQGRKLSKRDGAITLRALREKGAGPADIRALVGL